MSCQAIAALCLVPEDKCEALRYSHCISSVLSNGSWLKYCVPVALHPDEREKYITRIITCLKSNSERVTWTASRACLIIRMIRQVSALLCYRFDICNAQHFVDVLRKINSLHSAPCRVWQPHYLVLQGLNCTTRLGWSRGIHSGWSTWFSESHATPDAVPRSW